MKSSLTIEAAHSSKRVSFDTGVADVRWETLAEHRRFGLPVADV